MTPLRHIRTLTPGEVDRIRKAYLEGVAIENIRERFRLSASKLSSVVGDLPKRERTRQTKRTTARIPGDLTT